MPLPDPKTIRSAQLVSKSESAPTLSILLPVRNEAASLSIMLRVLSVLVAVPHELLVIHDNPSDDSVPVVTDLSRSLQQVRAIHNTEGTGVLNAVRAGVNVSRGKYVLIYAADEIGPVLAIPNMLDLMDQGFDFVSGTRYSKGGRRYGGSAVGHLLSLGANKLFNCLSGTRLTDCTTGIKMFRREDFVRLCPSRNGHGWSFAFEMAIQAQTMNLAVEEVPIVSIDRLFGGESTFRLIPWLRSYFRLFFWGLRQLPPWHSRIMLSRKIAGG